SRAGTVGDGSDHRPACGGKPEIKCRLERQRRATASQFLSRLFEAKPLAAPRSRWLVVADRVCEHSKPAAGARHDAPKRSRRQSRAWSYQVSVVHAVSD